MESTCLLKHTGCSLSRHGVQLHFTHFYVQVLVSVPIIVIICFKISSGTSVNLVHSCSCFREQTGSAAGWGTSGPVQLLPRALRLRSVSFSLFHQLFCFFTRVWLIYCLKGNKGRFIFSPKCHMYIVYLLHFKYQEDKYMHVMECTFLKRFKVRILRFYHQ